MFDIWVVLLCVPSVLSVFQVATFQGFIPLLMGFLDPISVVFPVLIVTSMVLALCHLFYILMDYNCII